MPPIKEFECLTCYHNFDRIVAINTFQTVCPKCNSLSHHVFSHTPAFKGGEGFYNKNMSIPKDKDK